MGAGLAVLTGLRAFLPLAFVALYSRLEFASSPHLTDTPFAFLENWWVIGLLLGLAVIEMAADKILSRSVIFARATQPVKIIFGGVVFAAAMAPEGWVAMLVTGILGLLIAGLADHVWRRMRPASAEKAALVLISLYVDIIVLVGTLLFVLVPLIGALLTCFLVLVFYRVRVVSRRKHRGLRILRD
ncbi:MAG: DUF4126 domain-containing protein [Thermoleophilia bacterium]|nr:DUF4126 domain-containing protein [Thermoleophilia bacterium]